MGDTPGIDLMTYCFNTKPSDPVVALLHDLHTIKEVKQRGGGSSASVADGGYSVVGSVDCRSYHHMGDEDDDVSQLSEATPDWQSMAGVSNAGTLVSGAVQGGKRSSLGRRSVRLSLHGLQANNKGKALLTDEDMTTYEKYLSVSSEEADYLKQTSLTDVHCLLGWQVMLPTVFTEDNSGML